MRIYTYSQARQKLASLLDAAGREGQVRIRRRDGQVFAVRPVEEKRSPLDVPGLSTRATTADIVDAVRASRRRTKTRLAGPGRRSLPDRKES